MAAAFADPLVDTEHNFSNATSSFMIFLSVLLQEQPVVVFLLGKTLASCLLAIDERGGHQDLHGSDRRSVIPYVHGRIELYCSSLTYLCEHEPFFDRPL
jgi:hypothetical protein